MDSCSTSESAMVSLLFLFAFFFMAIGYNLREKVNISCWALYTSFAQINISVIF